MERETALTEQDDRYDEIFDVEKENGRHAMIDEPYQPLAALRRQGPVLPIDIEKELTGHPCTMFKGRRHFTTLSFDACSKALLDNNLYSSAHYHEIPEVWDNIGNTILTMGGNEHARYRSAIQPMMTRQHVMSWWREMWIEPFVEILLDEMEGMSGVNLVMQLCARLPMHTVSAAYGLNSEEALTFRANLLNSMGSHLTPKQRHTATQAVRTVLLDAIAERRRERRDDLISRLIDAPFKDAQGQASRLSDDDIIAFSRLLLLAGGGTTFRQLGITLFALLTNCDQMEDLRADRSLMQGAIEESVRWNSTDPLFFRLATRDSVLEGVEIPEGSIVDVCLGAGNRDPERWDNPDAYDLHRPMQRHVGFAGGPHTCLGRFVAEAELSAAIGALLDRFPKMRLDPDAEPARIIGGLQARGVNHLQVRLD